ncbi:hypothetical protein F5Y14DRAFT_427516 [Nemania sp. NC0429]|nr:hypothetical protein F5Y14DRAFT_427516 [Nemania sp. NC0429]
MSSTTSYYINENTIICLSLAAEDACGHSELQLHKRRLIPTALDNADETRPYNRADSPSQDPAGREIITGPDHMVYFDHDTTEKLELYQTKPLQRVADTKTVAVNWMSLRTREKLEESLIIVYSRLRNIERIAIAVDHEDFSPASTSPLGAYAMSHDTVLEYGTGPVNWCAVGREIQQTLRSQAFWRKCNRRYALEQILPVQMNPPRVPRISLIRIAGGRDHDHDHEGNPRLPPQTPQLVRGLAPDLLDVENLWNPEQPEHPVFADYDLQDLLV